MELLVRSLIESGPLAVLFGITLWKIGEKLDRIAETVAQLSERVKGNPTCPKEMQKQDH